MGVIDFLMKPPFFIVVAVCIAAGICASLGWLGITQQVITTASKVGISTSRGLSAVVQGWFWFAAALVWIGLLAINARFRNLIWLGLACFYVLAMAAYLFLVAPSL